MRRGLLVYLYTQIFFFLCPEIFPSLLLNDSIFTLFVGPILSSRKVLSDYILRILHLHSLGLLSTHLI